MVEQHSFSSDFDNRYKFNGKELDVETGLYYYGARYYNPQLSIWLSVDPLAEKFPNWNPYNYVMQNPINLIDPTGMSPSGPGDYFDTIEEAAKDFALNYNGLSIINNVEIGAILYEKADGCFSYTEPTGSTVYTLRKNKQGVPTHREREGNAYFPQDDLDKIPANSKLAGIVHCHAWDRSGRSDSNESGYEDNDFSPGDKDVPSYSFYNSKGDFLGKGIPIFVATPNGKLKVYGKTSSGTVFNFGRENIGGLNIPSDPNSPSRINKVSPNVCPNIDPIVIDGINGLPIILHSTFDSNRRYHIPPF